MQVWPSPGAKPLLARHEALEATASRSYPWDALGLSRADRAIAFLEHLEITAGKHARTKLRLRQWRRRFVEAVYREDKRGIRPIRTAVSSMARKNGKSQLAAALALCHLCGPEAESRGEIYSCANDRFQAGRIFNEMVALISRHPALWIGHDLLHAIITHLARRPEDPGENDRLIILAFDRHGKRRDLAVGHVIPPTLDEFQCAVLLEDDGSGFCMFLVDCARTAISMRQ